MKTVLAHFPRPSQSQFYSLPRVDYRAPGHLFRHRALWMLRQEQRIDV